MTFVLAVIRDASGASPGFARRLAREINAGCRAVVPNSSGEPPGAWDTVWYVDDGDAASLAAALAPVVTADGCQAVVFDDDVESRELAGRLAARSGLPCVGAVVGARERDGVLQVTRHAAGGGRTAIVGVEQRPALLVVDSQAAAAESAGAPEIRERGELAVGGAAAALELIAETRPGPWEMDVTEADVIVAGGRGVGGPEGFSMLAELAGLLGGTVAGTRVAVDAGWVPYARQVGLTGKTVSPRLYIACGISGAIHHTLGMRSSGQIIAINTDERAPIFQVATVSVVADVDDVVPKLIQSLRSHAGTAVLQGAGR